MKQERTVEILCVGTELLMGNTVNTNATALARGLAGLGLNLYHQTVVGDNPQRLRDALELAFSRADIVITSGGLGPTYDDMTKETVAGYFHRELALHQPSLEAVRAYFKRLGRTPCPNNEKQAMMPRGAVVFPNPNGTAPGCAIVGEGAQAGKIAILLPGPPRELEPMFEHSVAPFLLEEDGTRLVSRCLYFFGIGESALAQRLDRLMRESKNPTVAPYCKIGEVMLRVTARVGKDEDASTLMAPALEEIHREAGEWLYGEDVGDLQTALVRELAAQGLHIAVAESCTGGGIAQRITQVPGASGVFEGGFVTYSNRLKEQLLGVQKETLEKYSAVSSQTAAEMAAGARRVAGAEIGLATTGNAGPAPSEGKPVGLVYVAVDSDTCREVLTLNLPYRGDDARGYIRELAASHALHLALKAAKNR